MLSQRNPGQQINAEAVSTITKMKLEEANKKARKLFA
jgi:hypothetical protein